jgi:hypothetical protein
MAEFTLSNLAGAKAQLNYSTPPFKLPNTEYKYLLGEDRIRETPSPQYDIPNAYNADAINYNEAYVFFGAMDRYTWKLLCKKEMIVKCNQLKAWHVEKSADLMGAQFSEIYVVPTYFYNIAPPLGGPLRFTPLSKSLIYPQVLADSCGV